MKLPTWLKKLLISIARKSMIELFHDILDNPEVTESVSAGSYELGKWITDNGKEQMGDRWEELETKLQDLSGTAHMQCWNGLDHDDKE